MSSLITRGNAAGTGSVTLESPNTNSDFTISLPATTGTVVLAGTTPSFNGITFPATQVPSADANTLDDYEEGTWTPSIGGTATYTARSGTYTKVGNIVNITFDITINIIGTGSQRVINNIPFTVATSSSSGGSIGYWESTASSINFITARVDAGSTNMILDATSAATTTMTGVNVFQSGARIIGTVTYRAS